MEYENIKNIELIVNILKLHNIRDLVISPGGTNVPLVRLVQNDSFFNCYSVVDERSAAYFAIGLYLQKKSPIALICTSAQATRNYIPGLTEAFYKRVPLLAITMEKHPRFKYQNYMQAPDQTSLPNDSVKKSFELPFLRDRNDFYHSRRVINEAILELSHNGLGPVQLCVPWLDFKISEVEPTNLKIERFSISELDEISLSGKKVLVLIGEHLPFTDAEKRAINHFCENADCVIYTNHLSNFSNAYSINGNLLLSTINDKEFEKIKPDVLITIGNQTGDYPFYLRFSKTDYPQMEHWLITPSGESMDTYDKLTRIYQGDEEQFFLKAETVSRVKHEYLEAWQSINEKLKTEIEVPLSNLYIAQCMHDKLPQQSIIQFSILNSLRVWNLFDLDPSIQCYSNVGAFGIDGGMSTLIGQSVATDKPAFLIIGDLAFFYDMNSLGIRHIKNNLRIILVNNNGGVEFKLHGEKKDFVDNYIAAANHFKNAKGWSETCGFEYLSASTKDEFNKASKQLLTDSQKPIILEVFVSDSDEGFAYNSLIDENSSDRLLRKMKSSIKSHLKK